MNFLVLLRQEWEVVRKSPFACALCLAVGFAIGTLYYSGQVNTLSQQVQFWKDRASAVGTATATATINMPPSNNTAHFLLNIEGATCSVLPSDPKITEIVFDATIRNSGGPSVATGWKLTVTPKGGDAVLAQYEPIPKGRLDNLPLISAKSSESLADQVAKHAIPAEKVISGRLMFHVRMPLATVQDPASVFTLSVQDLVGNPFSTSRRAGEIVRR